MRRTVILLTGLVLTLIISMTRALNGLPYSDISVYMLNPGTEYFLLLLVTLIGLYVLSYAIQKTHGLPEEFLILLIASPPILSALTRSLTPIIVAIIACIFVLLWKKPAFLLFVSVLAPIAHPSLALLSLLASISLLARKKYFLGGTAFFTTIVWLYVASPGLEIASLHELGSTGGQSLLILLLAVIGLLTTWNQNNYKQLIILTIVGFGGMHIAGMSIVAALAVAALAGFAIEQLRTRSWRLESIQSISILFVVLGLLFTAASTAADVTRAEPTEDIKEIADILRTVDAQDVYASQEDSIYLQYLGVQASDYVKYDIQDVQSVDELVEIIPRYIILPLNAEPRVRFFIENSDNFILLHRSSREMWEVRR